MKIFNGRVDENDWSMRILIIGGGNMGSVYAESFLKSHIVEPSKLMILEKSPQKAEALRERKLGSVFLRPQECLPHADLVVLAVKPQDTGELFRQIGDMTDTSQVVLSIMAGVKMRTIADALKVDKIVRAMPNLPAKVGRGMTVFTAAEAVTRIELAMVQNLINTTGKSLYVQEESMLDAATAISGSGPAYVWYFMDALVEAAQKMGFNKSEAELLVSQTFLGAIQLYQASDLDLTEWIQRVCSRGGTTEAALADMDAHRVRALLCSGADAALRRAKELGDGKAS